MDIVQVWEARGLTSALHKEGPSAVFRVRLGQRCAQSLPRPPSRNPHWGDEENSARCRHSFRYAPQALFRPTKVRK